MNFLRTLFAKKEKPINSYDDFWNWFQAHNKEFFKIVENHHNIVEAFFDKLGPKLDELKEGFFYVCGMYDANTAELVITADSNPKNVAFVEELVLLAPKIDGWKFTALKPAMDIENVSIEMDGFTFNEDNLSFFASEYPEFPDEIDITIVHSECTQENRNDIACGVYIFLDNYLGELAFLTDIDEIKIDLKPEGIDLIPISKLKHFLNWRKKEFIEKYQGIRHNTENDAHSMFEAQLKEGDKLIAVINKDLLAWDAKASHPWIAIITIKYDGSKNNGMPNSKDFERMETIEMDVLEHLKDMEGYLNIGRQTSKGEREIYFACRDFRQPSKVFYATQLKHKNDFEITYEISKDKYWQSFKRFNA